MKQSAAQQLSRRICFTLGILLAGLFAAIAVSMSYAMTRELWLIQATGYTALGALFVALLITPTLRLLRYATVKKVNVVVWTAFRRSFGISAACFASMPALRIGPISMVVINRMRDVAPAATASVVMAS